MEDLIPISFLNDFIFCPVSIYFHNLYGKTDKMLLQCSDQINGSHAHSAVDTGRYSNRKNVLQSVAVYCEKYRIMGKIDVFDAAEGLLTERKKKISTVYDGYIFQLYAQYFALKEMGYQVKRIRLYSMDSNKVFPVLLPEENKEMLTKFEEVITQIRQFDIESFKQTNSLKCKRCIYEPVCDRSIADDEHQ